jgi:hypothetical protein
MFAADEQVLTVVREGVPIQISCQGSAQIIYVRGVIYKLRA